MDDQKLQATKIGTYMPVTAELLLDAGLPLPLGMEPPPPYTPTPQSRRTRRRIARAERIDRMRRRIGFWIAGYEPDDEDW